MKLRFTLDKSNPQIIREIQIDENAELALLSKAAMLAFGLGISDSFFWEDEDKTAIDNARRVSEL